MSKIDLHEEMIDEANETSADDGAGRSGEEGRALVFYRRRCPECGKDALNLIDSGVFMRSPIVGITSDGEIGCSYTELEGDFEPGIYCRSCGHQVCSDSSLANACSDEFLSEWAKSAVEARTAPPFRCPDCDSLELHQVEVGIELSHEVVAVCEPVVPDSAPLVAVSHVRDIDGGGTYRYRCSQGHELAKEDGTAVETAEELADWLKARCAIDQG